MRIAREVADDLRPGQTWRAAGDVFFARRAAWIWGLRRGRPRGLDGAFDIGSQASFRGV
jgi:hypothetical protein